MATGTILSSGKVAKNVLQEWTVLEIDATGTTATAKVDGKALYTGALRVCESACL